QGHLDIDDAVFVGDELVDEAELDDVHGNVRIVHRAHRLEHALGQSRVVLARGRTLDLLARRHLVAMTKIERILACHDRYSVLTVAPTSPALSAASKARQARVAHLTRAG